MLFCSDNANLTLAQPPLSKPLLTSAFLSAPAHLHSHSPAFRWVRVRRSERHAASAGVASFLHAPGFVKGLAPHHVTLGVAGTWPKESSLLLMARKLRVQYEGAVYHVMSPGDRREDNFSLRCGPLSQRRVDTVAVEPRDLFSYSRSDPRKLATAARLRQETTLLIRQIAERLHLGKPKGATTNLHQGLYQPPRQGHRYLHKSVAG
jgi:hypothetical protein